jgi:hypothetical protein
MNEQWIPENLCPKTVLLQNSRFWCTSYTIYVFGHFFILYFVLLAVCRALWEYLFLHFKCFYCSMYCMYTCTFDLFAFMLLLSLFILYFIILFIFVINVVKYTVYCLFHPKCILGVSIINTVHVKHCFSLPLKSWIPRLSPMVPA